MQTQWITSSIVWFSFIKTIALFERTRQMLFWRTYPHIYPVIYSFFRLRSFQIDQQKCTCIKKASMKSQQKTDPNYINKMELKVISSGIVRADVYSYRSDKKALKKCHWIEIEWNLTVQRDVPQINQQLLYDVSGPHKRSIRAVCKYFGLMTCTYTCLQMECRKGPT